MHSRLRPLLLLLACSLSCGFQEELPRDFVPITLPRGVRAALPGGWIALSGSERVALDALVKRGLLSAALPPEPSELEFAANLVDTSGQSLAKFNIRYYPDLPLTQEEARAANQSDVEDLDRAVRDALIPGVESVGFRVAEWIGTRKELLNGKVVFISEYRRSAEVGRANFCVRLVRAFNADSSFTITVSYREDHEAVLRPISDQIIESIHF